MKLLTALLLATAAFAGPVIEHPNSQPNFPEPVINNSAELDIEDLRRQNPQYDVFFAGGIVGLFGRVPYAPVWTTPNIWSIREEPNFERWGFPGNGTPVIVPPPDRPHHPHHPHWPPPPPPDCPPDSPDGPAVPEPAGSLMIAAGLALTVFATRRFM